jgi:pimeloyl-ACP methyl ester carboxylesterase
MRLSSALSIARLAVSSAAAQEKTPNPSSEYVTSWGGAKIHYIEARRLRQPNRSAEIPNPVPSTASTTKGNASDTEARQAPSILFVPGFTMPAWIWEKQIAHFSAGYRVVAMDLRSQGESSKTGEGDYPAAHGRDINALVEQLHLAPVVLVGWSMGVTVIASYVDQFGANALAGIVFVDGVAGLDLTTESMEDHVEFLKGLQTNRSQLTADFVRSMYRKPQSEEYLQRVMKASLATPTESAIAMGLASFTTDNRPVLGKINKPL